MDTSVEKRQARLQKNSEATDRWMRRLLAAAHMLEKLRNERKRLMRRHGPGPKTIKYRRLEDIPRMAGGGDEFSDDIPL